MALGDFKESLKQQADIVRIVGDYVKLKKAGAQNYSGLCPFHGEKTPSFSVHATRQFYHCFGCGASGDVFSFVQKVENISFPEAVRVVAEKLGIALPKTTFSSPAEAKEARARGALMDIHERACAFFQECLRRPEGARAREYLKGRGVEDEIIARFRIGFAPDSGFLLRDRLRGEFGEEVLRESGLFSWKETAVASGQPPVQPGEKQVLRSAQDDKSNKEASAGSSSQPSAVGSQESQKQVLRSAQDDKLNKEGQTNGRELEGRSQQPEAESSKLEASSQQLGAKSQELRAKSHAPEAAAMYSKFRGRVMFPITNDAGKIIAFTGRTLATDEKAGPKYLNSPETAIYSKSRVLFNLDKAKEAIRKLDYVILVEGQMDCISVFAAGFQNVIASSGTAFTELQAKLLGRFSKNVVVNFDPDTAGARATERTLGLLVSEEFQIKVLSLEQGFDPDLFIRRKGKEAYAEALRGSQPYFSYLIERARAQFSVRSPDGKVKAVNHLLPHIQRVPSRIVRDELAHEIAQKLGIDSAVLRQELKHAAGARSSGTIKAAPEAQVTDAERLVIRALASARMMTNEEHLSGRDGAEEEFDPSRQARFAIQAEGLHMGLATEALIDVLLNSEARESDVMDLPLPEGDRNLVAAILMKEEEELTAERLEGAVRALRRMRYRRMLEQVQRELETCRDRERLQELLQERVRLKRALMDPGLNEGGSAA
jgi:DNA primase